MAEITIRRTGELLRGVFSILKDAPDGLPAREVLERLEGAVPPTDFERSEYPNSPGVRRYEKIVRFSTVSCVKAGWLVKLKGRWALTDEGRQAYDRLRDPEDFRREVYRLYRRWKAQQAGDGDSAEETAIVQGVETGQTVSRHATFEEAEEAGWEEIRSYVSQMNPYDFQRLIGGLLKAMGNYVVWTAPPGPDAGVDIIASPDPLGIQEPKIKVAVRRREERASVQDLRQFLALLHGSDAGIFVSVSGFT